MTLFEVVFIFIVIPILMIFNLYAFLSDEQDNDMVF